YALTRFLRQVQNRPFPVGTLPYTCSHDACVPVLPVPAPAHGSPGPGFGAPARGAVRGVQRRPRGTTGGLEAGHPHHPLRTVRPAEGHSRGPARLPAVRGDGGPGDPPPPRPGVLGILPPGRRRPEAGLPPLSCPKPLRLRLLRGRLRLEA